MESIKDRLVLEITVGEENSEMMMKLQKIILKELPPENNN